MVELLDPVSDLVMDAVVPRSASFCDDSIASSLSTPEADLPDVMDHEVVHSRKRRGGRKPVCFFFLSFFLL